MPYRILLFDLFGTLVLFKPKVPTLTVAGTAMRSTMHWLRDGIAQELPDVRFESLIESLREVTEEIVRGRPPEYLEVSSADRFRRALQRLGLASEVAAEAGRRLSLRHMEHLAASTETPREHEELLRELAKGFRLGLISNFDHGPTARRILADSGLARHLETILISDDYGRRKPHAAIFRTALQKLGGEPEDALHIGDSLGEDVVGARAAGIDVAWINAGGEILPADAPQPTYVVRRLCELTALLIA